MNIVRQCVAAPLIILAIVLLKVGCFITGSRLSVNSTSNNYADQ